MPLRSAASMTSSPGIASMARPSTVICTACSCWVSDTGDLPGFVRADERIGRAGADEGGALHLDGRLARAADVRLELVLEPHDGGRDRRGGRLAERADGGLLRRPGHADRDVVAHVEQQVHVLGTALPVEDPFQDLLQPVGALTARRALAARL